MRRIGQFSGSFVLLAGVFWTGRESGHGMTAFYEHWWCPAPLVLALVGLAVMLLTLRLPRSSSDHGSTP